MKMIAAKQLRSEMVRPAAVGRPRRWRQEGFDGRPQLVGDELINEVVMAANHAIPSQGSETASKRSQASLNSACCRVHATPVCPAGVNDLEIAA